MEITRKTLCFVCSASIIPEEDEYNERSTLNSTSVSVIKSSHRLLLKYILGVCRSNEEEEEHGLYKEILSFWTSRSRTIGNNEQQQPLVRFCVDCEKKAENLLEKQVELEKIQMKMVHQLKSIKQVVIGNSRLYGSNLEVKHEFEMLERQLDAMEERGEDSSLERKFLEILHRFQMSVFEKDNGHVDIPLVLLEQYVGAGKDWRWREMPTTSTEETEIKVDTSKEGHESENEREDIEKVEASKSSCSSDPMEAMSEKEECSDNEEFESLLEAGNEIKEEFSDEEEMEGLPQVDGDFEDGFRENDEKDPLGTDIQNVESQNVETLRSSEPIQTVINEIIKPRLTLKRKCKEANSTAGTGATGEAPKRNRSRLHESGKQRFKCRLCSFWSDGNDCLIWQHIMQHEKRAGRGRVQGTYHRCSQCKLEFRKKESLEMHHHHHSISRQCDVCNEPVVQTEMEAHIKTAHIHNKMYKCEFCDFPFGTYHGMVLHTAYPKGYQIKCQLCPRDESESFNKKASFFKHLYQFHGITQVSLKCEYPGCTKEVFDIYRLNEHMNIHDNKYPCPHCNKPMASKTYLEVHIETVHEKKKKYQCDLCSKGFARVSMLSSHKIAAHGNKKFKCELCPGKQYSCKERLGYHKRWAHEESPSKCSICLRVFKNQTRLKEHVKRHASGRISKHGELGRKYNIDLDTVDPLLLAYLKSSFNNHVKKTGGAGERFDCEQCPFKAWCDCLIQQHIIKHENSAKVKPFDCPCCGLKFAHMQTLGRHLLQKHSRTCKRKCDVCGEAVKMFEMESHLEKHGETNSCEYCNFQFGSYKALVLHMSVPKGTEVKCQLCLVDKKDVKSFVKKIDLVKHLYESHGLNELVFKCDYPGCDKEFFNPELKNRHKHLHEKSFVCPTCGKIVSSQIQLKKHIRTVHKKELPLKCDLCQERFAYGHQLERHKISEHNMEKFKCKVCPDKEYITRLALLRHMEANHREVPLVWKCNICGKEITNRKQRINSHLLTHSDEKQFTCEICGFATRTSKLLARHMLQHGGEKKYKCSHCPKAFLALSALKCHERIHTGEKPYQCDLCGVAYSQGSQLRLHNKSKHNRDITIRANVGSQNSETEPSTV